MGRLAPEKGHHGLIQAFSAVLKSGIDAKLTIIGDGPLYQELSKYIIALNLQGRCVLAGQKTEEEVMKSLATTDLFVLSSFMEGIPVVLMEALGMRVAVIAPCVAGIPELVRHNESGLLFAPGNWNELAEQMEQAVGEYKSYLDDRIQEQRLEDSQMQAHRIALHAYQNELLLERSAERSQTSPRMQRQTSIAKFIFR